MEKVPTLIKQEEKKIIQLKTDISVLTEIIDSIWQKETLLSNYKNNLSTIERKIQWSLTDYSRDIDSGETSEDLGKSNTTKPNVKIN